MNPPVTNLKKIVRAIVSNDFPHLVEHEKDIIKINEKVFANIAWIVYLNGKVLIKNFATFFRMARTKRKRYDSGLKAVVETEPIEKIGCIQSPNIFDNPDFENERKTYESPMCKIEKTTSATKEEITCEFTKRRSKAVLARFTGTSPSMVKSEKITPETRAQISTFFAEGKSKAEIARMTNCSPMTVHFVLYPEKLAEMNEKQAKTRQSAEARAKNRERVRRCREKNKGYEQ